MGIEQLRRNNPTMAIHSIHEALFHMYGKVLSMDTHAICKDILTDIKMPEKGSVYEVDIEMLHRSKLFPYIQSEIFGELPIQAGMVYGSNQCLTGIEYHQGSEVNVAIQDCLLLLGKREDMVGDSYDASKCIAFYLEQGDSIELFSSILHYTPIQVQENGFCVLVYLLLGTNTPLQHPQGMLIKKNKWYITHFSQKEKLANGCIPGLLGDLIQVKYRDE